MASDDREQAEQDLLRTLQGRVNELKGVFEESSNHWGFKDPVYRFYHQSFKVRLIRFRGHLPKGGYDVPNAQRDEKPAPAPAV